MAQRQSLEQLAWQTAVYFDAFAKTTVVVSVHSKRASLELSAAVIRVLPEV